MAFLKNIFSFIFSLYFPTKLINYNSLFPIIQFNEIDNRDKASEFSSYIVYISRSIFPNNEEQVYFVDFIGCKIYDENKSRTDKIIIDRIISRKNKNNNSLTLSTLNEILKDVEDDDFRRMEFRNTGQSEGDLKTKIESLFNEAKLKWKGILLERKFSGKKLSKGMYLLRTSLPGIN